MRSSLREWLAGIPWLRRFLTPLYVGVSRLFSPVSGDYWEHRYAKGGTSGDGSIGRLAEFKARVLNDFVAEKGVSSVIEFGCGDGDQLELCEYPNYAGVDVSETILAVCRERFASDSGKKFCNLAEPETFAGRYDLALSLDVLYHLIEDNIFEEYMKRLFAASGRFVIIYSSNSAEAGGKTAPHVRHRNFTDWVEKNADEWHLEQKIDNLYPWDPADPDLTSTADFYLYGRRPK